METILVILLCIVLMAASISWIIFDRMEKDNETASELHARDRYAVSERIDRELEKKHKFS